MAVSCLVLSYQLMIMQNFANYSKFSETLVPSSALVYPTYVCSLSTSFTICVRPAECTIHTIVVVCSCDSSVTLYQGSPCAYIGQKYTWSSTFYVWLRQELKVSQCLSVCPSSKNLSGALNLRSLSGHGLSK